MQINQIDQAVSSLCFDVQSKIQIKKWTSMTNLDLLTELINSILGSNVRYEMSITYAFYISSFLNTCSTSAINKNYIMSTILQILSSKAHNQLINITYNSYRFPNRATDNIVRTFIN